VTWSQNSRASQFFKRALQAYHASREEGNSIPNHFDVYASNLTWAEPKS